jgi:hypothetical protein
MPNVDPLNEHDFKDKQNESLVDLFCRFLDRGGNLCFPFSDFSCRRGYLQGRKEVAG